MPTTLSNIDICNIYDAVSYWLANEEDHEFPDEDEQEQRQLEFASMVTTLTRLQPLYDKIMATLTQQQEA